LKRNIVVFHLEVPKVQCYFKCIWLKVYSKSMKFFTMWHNLSPTWIMKK
jgi:hypothetical protein